MKFTITTPIHDHKPRSVYSLQVDFMHGDGDRYETCEMKFKDDAEGKARLEEVVVFLRALDKLHLRHSNDECDLRRGIGIEKFGLEMPEALAWNCWPDEDGSDGDCKASYRGFALFFYGVHGEWFNVSIEN